jgi:hypothetical protein
MAPSDVHYPHSENMDSIYLSVAFVQIKKLSSIVGHELLQTFLSSPRDTFTCYSLNSVISLRIAHVPGQRDLNPQGFIIAPYLLYRVGFTTKR